jgi:hypothetical protein
VISAALCTAPRFFDGTVAGMSDVVERFLHSLETRDYERLADCFSATAKLRALVPSALREAEGTDAIVARFRLWFDDLDEYELVSSDSERVLDRERVSYRIRGVDPEDGRCQMEQHGYATVEDGQISALNLVCSGFRQLA